MHVCVCVCVCPDGLQMVSVRAEEEKRIRRLLWCCDKCGILGHLVTADWQYCGWWGGDCPGERGTRGWCFSLPRKPPKSHQLPQNKPPNLNPNPETNAFATRPLRSSHCQDTMKTKEREGEEGEQGWGYVKQPRYVVIMIYICLF